MKRYVLNCERKGCIGGTVDLDEQDWLIECPTCGWAYSRSMLPRLPPGRTSLVEIEHVQWKFNTATCSFPFCTDEAPWVLAWQGRRLLDACNYHKESPWLQWQRQGESAYVAVDIAKGEE